MLFCGSRSREALSSPRPPSQFSAAHFSIRSVVVADASSGAASAGRAGSVRSAASAASAAIATSATSAASVASAASAANAANAVGGAVLARCWRGAGAVWAQVD